MSLDAEVVISGAGAAGLTLAVDLARRHVDFILVEQSARPFHGSRGKGIQPRTQEVFEDLGLLDRLAAAGGPYPPLRVHRSDGSHADTLLAGDDADSTAAEPYATPLMVMQSRTEAILRERLAELGHRPRFGHRLTGFDQDEDGVSVVVESAEGRNRLRARYLIACDGGRSFVRHALAIGFPGESLGVRALVADVDLVGLSRDAWHRFQLGDGATQVMACPLAGTDLFQIQAPVAGEGDEDVSPGALTALLAERSGRDDILVRSVLWSSLYSMSVRLADRYRVGRVFLAGDAAHIHPPTGGQGLNTSIQDAYNLGWKLSAVLEGAPDTLLDSYEEERRPIAATMLALSTRMLGEARNGPMRRNREVRQLDLGYHGSSLSATDLMGKARIRPGDRAPDAPCLGRRGQPTRLFALFAGPHWTLLGYEATERPRARRGVRVVIVGSDGNVVDNGGHVAAAYALPVGGWALIRPDGYVAAVLAADELSSLARYLDRVMSTADASGPDPR